MAMAAGTCLNIRSPSSSTSSWVPIPNTINGHNPICMLAVKRCVSNWGSCPSLQLQLKSSNIGNGVILTALSAVAEEEREFGPVTEEHYEYHSRSNDDVLGGGLDDDDDEQHQQRTRPCELYVCNLPRSIDIPDLMEMFKLHGTVLSVEVARSPDTGLSRGCGYVTMGSINIAKSAIAALDKSDVGGREMRVRFSVHMNPKRRNSAALNSSSPVKNMMYESPHKLYVGNLAWAVQPHVLRSHFSQFGTVASARVLHDRKAGKNRAYGFLSFSSSKERDAAMSLDGTEFCGRRIVVRGHVERTYPSPKS